MKLKAEKQAEYQEIKKALRFAEQQVDFWRETLISCDTAMVTGFKREMRSALDHMGNCAKAEKDFLLNDGNFDLMP
jgi:hypothetical protein